ncbi:MAG TPA: peptide chain release factor N(5)-glutamine methyltransferase [Gammaproteobacteria bacterium]
MDIRQLIESASQQLSTISDSPRLDAEILLAHSLGKARSYLLTWPENIPQKAQLQQFQQLLQQRLQGHPIAHLTGEREFWSLPLQVSPDTLIPRPDTELMVEQILAHYPTRHPTEAAIQLLDLGTGSGAIALALAHERPSWQITASDQSEAALRVAQRNAKRLGISVEFIHSDWFSALQGRRFDVIASNPPYIPQSDPHLSQGDVRFEPLSALASGDDGLDAIRHICATAPGFLKTGGQLFIEHGYDQKTEVNDIFHKNHFHSIQQYHDLSGNPRLTSGIFS